MVSLVLVDAWDDPTGFSLTCARPHLNIDYFAACFQGDSREIPGRAQTGRKPGEAAEREARQPGRFGIQPHPGKPRIASVSSTRSQHPGDFSQAGFKCSLLVVQLNPEVDEPGE